MGSDRSQRTLIGDETAGGEDRFKLLLDTLPHIAFAIFVGGQAEYYNRAFIDYVGEAPGPDSASRTALHHPEDRPKLEAARQAALPYNLDYIVEARIRRHDGEYRWHRIHNKPLIRNGRRIGSIGTAVDIHDVRLANEALEQRVGERTAALRASEAGYRTLYNRTPMALHSVDSQARLLDVNDTWTELFDWTRDEVLGRSPAEFMTPASAAVYREVAWPMMLASSGEVRTAEYQFVTKQGRVFDGRLAARGEFDGSGRFIRSWSAIADVTMEKRAEQELRQMYRMEAVGQLTAGIAHDFNNLITAILGNIELLQRPRERLDERSNRLLDGVRTAAERGAAVTRQLLAFSRQQRIEPRPVDLNRLTEGMRPLLQSTLGATIAIGYETAPSLWTALADPTQLELAVLNLAINARDAMPQGGTITIATRNATLGAPTRPEAPDAGDYACLTVCDTGSGMQDAVRERVFEPFFTTKEVGKGSGLGLPQVLGVLKQLGGGIEIRSGPDQGTCVTLFLPRSEAGAEAAPPPPPGAVRVGTGPSLRIVVVDDDPAVRQIAADMLRASGHVVEDVETGTAVLACLEQERWDVLLADVAMPGMNGVELAGEVRRRWPGLPVLFMTGYADERLLPSDAAEVVIRKPFTAADLESQVLGLMGQ